MIQVVANHGELIFFLLTSPKWDLGEVEKANFQGVAWHFDLILDVLTKPNFDLREVEKAMFQGLAWHSQLILDLWTSQKCDLKWKKRCFKVSNGIHNLFWAFGLAQNAIWMKSKSDDLICRMSL